MTPEEKDLLLKDLCARLPYGVIVNVKGFDYDYNDKLTQIYKGVGCSIQVTTNMPYDIEQVKPYLFPLSTMSDEQYENFLLTNSKITLKGVICSTKGFEFLNKHHFDYRGLISMGLAKDATGLNIY